MIVAMLMNGITSERREREPPVEDEEEDCRADQRERVLDEARDAVGDELVERLDVVRQPADDHAGAVPFEEAEREPLQMVEELVAQVGQDPLADPAGQVRLHVAHAPVREAGEQEHADDPPQLLQVVLADAVVDCVLREQRRRERRGGRRAARDDRRAVVRASGTARACEPDESSPSRAPRRCAVATAPVARRSRAAAAVAIQVRCRALPDPHRRVPPRAACGSALRASTASANWRSSRPCS